MGYPTKVQLIKRKQSEQWYINFPAAVAQAMEFERGETVEWIVEDKESLVLRRQKVPPSALKKKIMCVPARLYSAVSNFIGRFNLAISRAHSAMASPSLAANSAAC